MSRSSYRVRGVTMACFLGLALHGHVDEAAKGQSEPPKDGSIAKAVVHIAPNGENLLKPAAWRPLEQGYRTEQEGFCCENGSRDRERRGLWQRVVLNQQTAQPIVATAWSKADGVSGTIDDRYALYLDLVYNDGTELWGQVAGFRTGTHDWQREEVVVYPEKPIKSVDFNLLLREHAGKAWFREPILRSVQAVAGNVLFDGVHVVPHGPAAEGFQVRDVANGSDFVRIVSETLGLHLDVQQVRHESATYFDVSIRDTAGRDRAVTLFYGIPVPPSGVRWLADPRHSSPVEGGREYVQAASFRAGANGRLSTYPLGAVASSDGTSGQALAIDMAYPAFYRIGYNAGTGELWIAYDLGLTPEKPLARIRFCRFDFAPEWGFRSALTAYYRLFPEAFRRRVDKQGLWMPFARISVLKNWEDFGFQFKEGNDETAWDDAHGIFTFRYTEPMTWWMPMSSGLSRTLDSATREARRLAKRGRPEAKALFTSGYHNANGTLTALFRDEPWNHGAVWSMNSMPAIAGEINDFKTKWNPQIRQRFYGAERKGDLDGEYIDSSEGYVTDELDYRRDHFAAAHTPLTFSLGTHQPAIFRGLIAHEYIQAIAADIHGMGKLMMANATPDRLCWLAPLVDVMGTETDWNPHRKWRPMDDVHLLYRRALCKGKPFCFLMNSAFEDFSHDLVEKYMKRSLAYGFFPGFFSHNAAEGHYFTRPELYERDRPLFRKYVPLCRLVSQASWEPITEARCSDEHVHIERFGDQGTRYLTVFNDSRDAGARRSLSA